MSATIWHNPNCGTSRKALAALREAGENVTVIPYLDAGWKRDELAKLIAEAGLWPVEALRRKGTDAEERGLTTASDEDILDAMVAEPRLVERPFVRTSKGTALCRPVDRLDTLLQA